MTPGPIWRLTRKLVPLGVLAIILIGPLLGGWQRLDRNYLSVWDGRGWDLPPWWMDRMPLGEAPAAAYEAIQAPGGGTALDLFSIPFIDPVGGWIALSSHEVSFRFLLAWLLTLGAALVLGRMFCGWICPFGTLSRLMAPLYRKLPWGGAKVPPPPANRSVRTIFLVAIVLAGAFGIPAIAYLFLPHLWVQHSVYAFWLMGGGGAAMGMVGGLLSAGLVWGPNVYCASVCPTGTLLGWVGANRPIGVHIAQPANCGAHCNLCTQQCWLGLDPAQGDPGPDCDSCARCFGKCPKNNLRVGWRWGRSQRAIKAAILLSLLGTSAHAESDRAMKKPDLVLESARTLGAATAMISIVNMEGIRLYPDSPQEQRGAQLTLFLARGERKKPNPNGRTPTREFYQGPLSAQWTDAEGALKKSISFASPNQPYSTLKRSLYRTDLEETPQIGDRIALDSVPGWFEHPIVWEIQPPNPGKRAWRGAFWAIFGFLFFGGVIAIMRSSA